MHSLAQPGPNRHVPAVRAGSGRAWQYWPGRKGPGPTWPGWGVPVRAGLGSSGWGLRGPGRRGARKPAAAVASGMMKTPESREAALQRRDYGDGGEQVKYRARSKTVPRSH